MKNFLLTLLLFSSFQLLASSPDNTGQINGTVTDSISGEPLVGANVYVSINGTLLGTTTDMEGYYVLKPLQPGLYDVKVSYIGYGVKTFMGIKVSQQNITRLNASLSNIVMDGIVVTPEPELIGMENTQVLGAEDLKSLPCRGIADKVSILPGIYQSDDGRELYMRGARPEATEYYIDNVKVIGSSNVPAGAVAEIMVYSGGIPARYGDVTSGVIIITTKSYTMYGNHFE